jgi:hypothetical protein
LIRDKGIELREQADDLSVEARRRAESLQVQMKQAVNEGKSAAATKKEGLLTQLDQDDAGEEPLAES